MAENNLPNEQNPVIKTPRGFDLSAVVPRQGDFGIEVWYLTRF